MNLVYQLAEIQPSVFLITAKNRYDLAQLFVCVQEFYESPDPQWKGKHFKRDEFERWYALNESDDQIYSYPLDWCGFNVPSTAIYGYYGEWMNKVAHNMYDNAIHKIVRMIEYRQGGYGKSFYLIGALANDLETLDHELAHGLYATNEEYRRMMDYCIAQLPKRTYTRLGPLLTGMGYDQSVHDDEIQANFATGLTNYFKGYQRYCGPFIEVFESFREQLTPQFENVTVGA